MNTKILADDRLLLKGFIGCPKCSRTLCGSASKGRNNYYYCYHCCSKCGCRYKANDVNNELIAFLKEYNVTPEVKELFKLVILDTYANDTAEHKNSKASLAKQLTEYSTKIARAREFLLTGDIDGTDYKQIKQDCERNISVIEAQLEDANKKNNDHPPFGYY